METRNEQVQVAAVETIRLWLEPKELRRAQARTVMARLEARKLDKRLEKEWAK